MLESLNSRVLLRLDASSLSPPPGPLPHPHSHPPPPPPPPPSTYGSSSGRAARPGPAAAERRGAGGPAEPGLSWLAAWRALRLARTPLESCVGRRKGGRKLVLGSSLPLLAKPGQSKECLSPHLACPSPGPTPGTLGLPQGRSSSHS